MSKIRLVLIGLAVLVATTSCSVADVVTSLRGGLANINTLVIANRPTDAPIPAVAFTRYSDIPTSTSDEGYPQLGDPQAHAQILAYMSFDCNHCAEFHKTTFAKLLPRIRSGDVLYTYVPLYGTGTIPNGRGVDIAALCANEQGKFWQYQEAAYAWEDQFSDDIFSDQRLRDGALNLNLDLAQWDKCVANPATGDIVDEANQKAFVEGDVTGTPAIAVNGVLLPSHDLDTINAAIDSNLPGN